MSQASFEPSPLAPRRTAEEEARDRDLGFGSVVSRESRQRLLNRDGSFNVIRSGLGWIESLSPYHQLLTTSWLGFLGLVGALYLVLNLIFAVAYVACGPDALVGPGSHMLGGRFSQAFFFSIQTFATIGYGQIGPNGLAANLVVTVEALVGLMYQALATGLLFARFARPDRVRPLQPPRRRRTVQRRPGPDVPDRQPAPQRNHRARSAGSVQRHGGRQPRRHGAPLLAAAARAEQGDVLSALLDDRPSDRRREPAGREDDPGTANEAEAEILVLLTGIDEASEQTVHARSSYRADEIVWNARFQSMFLPADGGSRVSVDISRVHEIEPA